MPPMGKSPHRYLRASKAGVLSMPNFRTWILPLATALAISAPLSAQAGVLDGVTKFLGLSKPAPVEDIPAPTADAPTTIAAPGSIAETISLSDYATPSLPTAAVAQLPQPAVETPLKKLFCVEYARALTGFNIFGDAKFWWERARNIYAPVGTQA